MAEETATAPAGTEETVQTPTAEVKTSTGSEAVTNTEETPKQDPEQVSRNLSAALKETREELKELKSWKTEQEEASAKAAQPAEPESEIDPDTAKILDGYMTKNGYVKKDTLDAQTRAIRADQELKDFQSNHKLSDKEMQQVKDAAIEAGAQNPAGLENAYARVFQDKILEDAKKEWLAENPGTGSTLEKPGGGGPTPPSTEPELTKDMSPSEKIKARIHAARNKQL